MKIKMVLILMLILSIPGNIYAEDNFVKKLDGLKEKLLKYFVTAPKPDVMQKMEFVRIWRLHRPAIRKELQQIRTNIIKMRKVLRRQLTHQQLLSLLDLKDQYCFRPPALKSIIFLAKLDPHARVELLLLLRRLRTGTTAEIAENVEALAAFFATNVRPMIIKKLALSPGQQVILQKIIAENRKQLRPKIVELIKKLFILRKAMRKALNAEQRAYLAANRDKIFQQIIHFVKIL